MLQSSNIGFYPRTYYLPTYRLLTRIKVAGIIVPAVEKASNPTGKQLVMPSQSCYSYTSGIVAHWI